MKSYSHYELKNEERINKIKSDNDISKSTEIVKYFVGNEDKTLETLLDNLIEIKNISEINEVVNNTKLSLHPMYFDLIKEFYGLNENKVKEIDEEWLSSFKSLANKIVWKIRLSRENSNAHEFHLNKALLIGIQL